MKYTTFYNTNGHDYLSYEKSHKDRLDFLVEDLRLNSLINKKIIDIGGGLGFIYSRLNQQIKFNYYCYDGTEINNTPFEYKSVDLDNFQADKLDFFDYALCFELIEHLTNPYNCLLQIKKMLKINGILFLTIPHIDVTHNSIYPSLIYPVQNFIQFLEQMAFEVKDHRIHDKNFKQEVFTLINKSFSESKMLFYKNEEKFRGIEPHISVNL